jgi:4-carboxymuconolactone decarboxylase
MRNRRPGPPAPGVCMAPRADIKNHDAYEIEDQLMGNNRLPELRRDQLSAAGQAVWDLLVETRGSHVVTAQGSLRGPFNAFVQAPDVGGPLASLGAVLRFGTSFGHRLTELAIITVAAGWQAEYEWMAHARLAREAGVSDTVVDAIGRREDPPFTGEDEQIVYSAARQLAADGHLSQAAYDAAHDLLGDAGVVELVALCGYYTTISFMLNAFGVPLPPGAQPMWPGSQPS